MSVTAVIPSVPPRSHLLNRALASVIDQTHAVDAISVAIDVNHEGPGATRTRALAGASTEWVAMLDDDDEWHSFHVATLLHAVQEHDADVAYSWFDVVGGSDPFPMFEGKPWSNDEPHVFGCWFIARTELLKDLGGWLTREQMGDQWKPQWQGDGSGGGEDWNLILRLVAANAKIVHVPKRSYCWHHDGQHYSGETW